MNLVEQIYQYNNDNVYFSEPISNNIIPNCNFIRIVYSSHCFSLNGVYLVIDINNVSIDKYYNKYKCKFDINANKYIIDLIKDLEINILKKINIVNKIPVYKIYDIFNGGNIKFFHEIDNICNLKQYSIVLKISGVWETDTEYGLTYKFVTINK